MSRLLLVRHGETSWNSEGRVQGHTNIPLGGKGLRQAERLRQRLAEVDIEVAYTSDLDRAIETAQPILKGRPIPLSPVQELRELCYGEWEGRTYQDIQAKDPQGYARQMARSPDFAPPQGESLEQLMHRVGGFISGLRQSHPEETVLIVGHGGALKAALISLLSLPLEAFSRFYFAPASLSIVDCYPTTDSHEGELSAVLSLFNDTSHLEEER